MEKFKASALAISLTALLMIANDEGYSSKPYRDINGVWTNGYGNATIDPTKVVSQKEALSDLKQNISANAMQMAECIKVPVTQNQYDAYINLSYNIGYNAFCKSTIVKKLNIGDDIGSCNAIMLYTFVGGKDCKIKSNKCYGIVTRREYEKSLCLKGLQ
jgi:lysozyme